MMKKPIFLALILVASVMLVGTVSADVNSVTPSTNDINRDNEWAHVNEISVGVGEVELQFVSTRSFYSCFEYRTDGDTSQMIDPDNYNTYITDGLYPYYCQNNDERTETISANEYVEVRMVFGAETDERFDWTRFDVLPPPTKADVLSGNGVTGKGIAGAPGLQKLPPNDNFAKGTGK
ncbi:MAG: hypothetical protein WBF08_04785 [Candidatus Bathyarchaeia archaeon]